MIHTELFTKGWTDLDHFAEFREAVSKGDCYRINRSIAAESADRKPVDAMVFAMRMPGMPTNQLSNLGGDIMTDARKAELHQIAELAEMRDEKLDNLSSLLPRGMRELSFFLEDELVPKYEPGKNYMTTTKAWESVQRGDKKRKIAYSGTTKIETLRDAASYVHSDNPVELWGRVAVQLLQWGVPMRTQERMNDYDGVGPDRFVCFGAPFMLGLMGHGVMVSGPLSFREKWRQFVPRPEQLSKMWLDMLIPMAYPEGSPMHPSRPAMHSFAALICCFMLLEIFDGLYMLPTGRTVEEELRLLADNVGYFRVHAGVHYQSDHDDAVEVCRTAAKTIVSRFLR